MYENQGGDSWVMLLSAGGSRSCTAAVSFPSFPLVLLAGMTSEEGVTGVSNKSLTSLLLPPEPDLQRQASPLSLRLVHSNSRTFRWMSFCFYLHLLSDCLSHASPVLLGKLLWKCNILYITHYLYLNIISYFGAPGPGWSSPGLHLAGDNSFLFS